LLTWRAWTTYDGWRSRCPRPPEDTDRRGLASWRVKDKLFVWERPLGKSLGDAAPDGVILGARVPDEGAKHALIAAEPGVYFTTPHFNGHPAVLVRVGEIADDVLEELVVKAWIHRAPPKVAAAYIAEGKTGG
jgi:hypothetical protein